MKQDLMTLIKQLNEFNQARLSDLNQALKFWRVHHFADDTNLLCLSNSVKKLNKLVNSDLKYLGNWLNANKISVNVKNWKDNL